MAVDMGFDESGSHDILLVSVQVGVVQRAKKLKTAWKTILRENCVPYFHSVDYDNFDKGIFRHLDRGARNRLLRSLGGHLRRRMLFGITGKITVSAYNAKTDNRFRSEWSAAYGFAMSMLMLQTRILLDGSGLGDEVNVLIEDGHKNSGQALQIVQRIKRAKERGSSEPALHVLSAALGSKADHPILQAADMLGYSEWQRLIHGQQEIYEELHVDNSRYAVAYMDLDKHLVDPALEIAKRSDEAKALLKKAHWHNKTSSQPS